MLTVFHARNTRSLRVLWILEELGIKAEVKSLQFPPRRLQPEYLSVNPTGAVPALVDDGQVLTESMAICEHLAAKHDPSLIVAPGESDRIQFLQWLWYGESTLMTPLSRIATVGRLERKSPDIDAIMADARDNAGIRLTSLEKHLEGCEFLAARRFTLADISLGYPLHLVGLFGLDNLLGPRTAAYRARLHGRPAFQRALAAP
ncbi:MAG: glutathione S-transferase family protein [Alphaproteobacteria bacterium]|nr:glutathione S-transferase family protein [Alphaproteobacteria bacterium]MCW5739271.1 glutathione S-transferase family protein [Alphaproteobacteria bacterium]